VNELRPVPRVQHWIKHTQQIFLSFLFFSSRFAFGSRQLCACRSCGSVSGAGPQRGGEEAVKYVFYFILYRRCPL
jgi:hypothetical protein